MQDIRIWKEDGWYLAVIPALGIADQARTLTELKKELKEAIELSVESILSDELGFTGEKEKALRTLFVDSVLDKVDSVISRRQARTALARA